MFTCTIIFITFVILVNPYTVVTTYFLFMLSENTVCWTSMEGFLYFYICYKALNIFKEINKSTKI